ncbi:MAG: DUF3006 domain-containing protein [Clostridia bacterium]|nr:DUF3006 domain-containing protein [Clostridia bacterium]
MTVATTYVLDRFEGESAILVGDDETLLTLPRCRFVGRREGDVFTLTPSGEPQFNEIETAARRARIKNRFARLARRSKEEKS